MSYKIEFSKKSIRDLDSIWKGVYYVSKSLNTTKKYISGILDTIEKKVDYPKSGTPLLYNGLFTGYYFVVYKSYMVFYRIEKTTVLVDRVLLGKSNYMAFLNIDFDSF